MMGIILLTLMFALFFRVLGFLFRVGFRVLGFILSIAFFPVLLFFGALQFLPAILVAGLVVALVKSLSGNRTS